MTKSITKDKTELARGVELAVSKMLSEISDAANWSEQRNIHSTVKPIDVMRYHCRLITPPGGTVLDPFNGSGSTGCAAVLEGLNYIGIEKEKEYVEISEARIAYFAQHQGKETKKVVAASKKKDTAKAPLPLFEE